MSEQALMTEVNGLSPEDIVQHLSKTFIIRWGNEAEEKLREYAEAGYTIQEAASFFTDKSFGSVRKKAARLGLCFLGQVSKPLWVDKAKEDLRQYDEAGYTIQQAASFFTDRSLRAVREQAATLGLRFGKGEK